MTDKAPNEMHVTKALAMIEQLLASQRNYQACAVLKSTSEYIVSIEKRLSELEAHNDAKGEAIAEAAE